MSSNGVDWVNVSVGIGYTMNPRPGGGIQSGGRSSIATDGDDVFMATSGNIYHFVAPGTNCVSGIVRDAANQAVSGAIVSTTFGNWAVTAADGSYAITNIGSSLYPITVSALAPGLAFASQTMFVEGALNAVNFTGITPVLSSIIVAPATNNVVAGGTTFFTATAKDQFGHPLEQQPAISWTASAGSINANGFFTSSAGVATTNVITASIGGVSGTAVAIGINSSVPFITSVSTNNGSVLGATALTITGGNFPNNAVVLFGGIVATINQISSNSISCTTPNISRSPTYGVGGLAPVSVLNGSGLGGTLPNAFDYLAANSQTFFVSIVGGTTGGQTQTSAAAGAVLNIAAAAPPAGQTFYAWSGGGVGDFGDITASNTTFTAPAHDVSIIATYKAIPTLPQTATPTISSNGAPGAQQITLSCATTNADIYYTLNGSDPTTVSTTPHPNGFLYTGPFVVSGASVTVKAIASAANRPDSAVASVALTIPPIEAWRIANFGTNASNVAIAGNAADPDGDGIVNLLEYAFGSDPNSFSPTNLPISKRVSISTDEFLAIEFMRATNATDVKYTVQTSPDLTSWLDGSWYIGTNGLPVTASTTEVSRSTNQLEKITVRDNSPMHVSPQKFIRVSVGLP